MCNSLISIIVPVFNVEKYLNKCIDSIINQTYRDLDIILVDDGSIDQSGRICDDYAKIDDRITVVHKNNEGVSAARNVGINHAKGKWISFVDADDWVNLNMYEVLVEEARDYDLTFFANTEYYKDNSIISYSLPTFESNKRDKMEEFILFLKKNCIHYEFFGFTWNKLFRNDIIRNNNLLFLSGLSFREDEIFTLNYCHYIKSLKFIPLPLYNYRRQWSGLTGRKKTSEDYFLLGMSIKKSEIYFSNRELVNYDLMRGYICLLKSINLSDNWNRAFYYLKETMNYIHNFSIKPIGRRDAFVFRHSLLWSKIAFILISILYNRNKVFSYVDGIIEL